MNFALTPDRIAAAYSLLRPFAPFSHWRMPAAGAPTLKFHAARDRTHYGWYYCRRQKLHSGPREKVHHIYISAGRVGSLDTLIKVMAHEMIHMHQECSGEAKGTAVHNHHFHQCAKQVCKAFAWDLQAFL